MPIVLAANGDEPIVGNEYLYREVAAFYDRDGSILHWVIVKGIHIVALRLREDYNPNIFNTRAEVWVGADSPTCIWGGRIKDINDHKKKTLPLFVKRKHRKKYEYLGRFRFADEIVAPNPHCDAAAIRIRREHNRGISRIVFLTRS